MLQNLIFSQIKQYVGTLFIGIILISSIITIRSCQEVQWFYAFDK